MNLKILFVVTMAASATAFAQTSPQLIAQMDPAPSPTFYHAVTISRNVEAVNYKHHQGATKVDFAGTDLMPAANGWARVDSKRGNLAITAEFGNLQKPTAFGNEYLTYVLWAVSPEGHSVNLGEVLVGSNHRSKIHAQTSRRSRRRPIWLPARLPLRQP